MSAHILSLPSEVQAMVWTHCPLTDIISFACTCRTSFRSVKHLLWKHIHIPWRGLRNKSKFPLHHVERLFSSTEMVFFEQVERIRTYKWGHVCHKFKKVLALCDSKKVRKLEFVGLIDDRGILVACRRFPCLREVFFESLPHTTVSSWQHVAQLQTLRLLSIRWCRIDDDGVAHISRSTSIKKLQLIGCKKLSEMTACYITTMRQVEALTISESKAFSYALSCLSQLPHLVHLDVSGTLIRNTTVAAIVAGVDRLESLLLNNCVLITDRVLKNLDRLVDLQRVEFQGTVVSPKALEEFSNVMGMQCHEGKVFVT